jgi:hypothetical protein
MLLNPAYNRFRSGQRKILPLLHGDSMRVQTYYVVHRMTFIQNRSAFSLHRCGYGLSKYLNYVQYNWKSQIL